MKSFLRGCFVAAGVLVSAELSPAFGQEATYAPSPAPTAEPTSGYYFPSPTPTAEFTPGYAPSPMPTGEPTPEVQPTPVEIPTEIPSTPEMISFPDIREKMAEQVADMASLTETERQQFLSLISTMSIPEALESVLGSARLAAFHQNREQGLQAETRSRAAQAAASLAQSIGFDTTQTQQLEDAVVVAYESSRTAAQQFAAENVGQTVDLAQISPRHMHEIVVEEAAKIATDEQLEALLNLSADALNELNSEG